MLPPSSDDPYLLGVHADVAYYFCPGQLDYDVLATFKTRAISYIVYAEGCMLSDEELNRFSITFKKSPRDIARI